MVFFSLCTVCYQYIGYSIMPVNKLQYHCGQENNYVPRETKHTFRAYICFYYLFIYFLVDVFSFFPSIFSLVWLSVHFHPLASSPLSHDRHQPAMERLQAHSFPTIRQTLFCCTTQEPLTALFCSMKIVFLKAYIIN